jgi:hypothetical protein
MLNWYLVTYDLPQLGFGVKTQRLQRVILEAGVKRNASFKW